MDKYKINYIFETEKDINEIFVNVLNKELKKILRTICSNKKSEVSSCVYLSLEGGNG